MMYWLIRATQVTSLTYRLLLTTMLTFCLIREGLSNAQRRKLSRQLTAHKRSQKRDFI